MLNKAIYGIAAIAAMIASPALSADMAVKAQLPASASPVSTWTGCYINGGVGYGMYNQDHFIINFNPGLNALNQTAGGRGWLGTVGGGCDYQFNNNFVVGALADYEFMNLKGSFADVDDGLGVDEKEHWAFAVGGRIGFLVTPQILAYVNGGGSWTQFSGVTFLGVNNLPDRASLPGHTFNGGFIGGGTEIAVQSVPGLYWRSEYRFASYRPADLQVFLNGVPIVGSLEHESKNVQTITTSLIWKFH